MQAVGAPVPRPPQQPEAQTWISESAPVEPPVQSAAAELAAKPAPEPVLAPEPQPAAEATTWVSEGTPPEPESWPQPEAQPEPEAPAMPPEPQAQVISAAAHEPAPTSTLWRPAIETSSPIATATSVLEPTAEPGSWVPNAEDGHAVTASMPAVAEPSAPDGWLPSASAAPQSPRPDPPRARGIELPEQRIRAVEAYCEAFCSPAQAGAATALVLEEFAAAQQERGQDLDEQTVDHQLLTITRTVAASQPEDTAAPAGWRQRLARGLSAEHRAECTRMTKLLAAQANGEIEPAELRELESHLKTCPNCPIAQTRMAEAERAFMAALRGEAATPERPTTDDLEPQEVLAVSDRRRGAVEAYCAAVCDASVASAAAAEALAAFASSPEATASDEQSGDRELVRVTRAVAAKHISYEGGQDADCVATPRVLAARLNLLIGENDLAVADRHLSICPACRALRDRMLRAERVWQEQLGRPAADETTVELGALGMARDTTEPQTRSRRLRIGMAAIPAGVAAAMVAIVLISQSGTSQPAATSAPPIANVAPAASTPAPAPPVRHHRAAAHKPRPHKPRSHKPAHPAPAPTVAATPSPTLQASAPTSVSTPPPSPSPAPAPAPAPPPPPSSGSSPGNSLSNQGSGLGSQPAPQKGIGKH